jgi:hypothetical protein
MEIILRLSAGTIWNSGCGTCTKRRAIAVGQGRQVVSYHWTPISGEKATESFAFAVEYFYRKEDSHE